MRYILIILVIVIILLIIFWMMRKTPEKINKVETNLREKRFADTLTYDFNYQRLQDAAPKIHES